MVRMRAPQRFALGTRVAIPVEGRTGVIEAFDIESGVYTLAFNDGFRQQVDAASVDSFVIRAPATAASTSTGSTTSITPSPVTTAAGGDPNVLLGARVVKVTTSYEGKKSVMEGQVASYFPDVQRYRVLLEDGVYVDMEVEEVKRAIAEAAEVGNGAQLQPKKRHRDGKDDSASRKKSKKSTDGTSSTSAIALDDDDQIEERRELPLNAKRFESRPVAYTIARKILITILEQHSTQKMRTEKQLSILRNDDIKPKRALEGFVEAGGLRAMQKVLQLWIKTPSTHPGALLALKVVALLPGVTMDSLMQSNIAQTLRSIERASQTTDLVDCTLGDLARWIIRNWKKNVVKRPVTPSPRDLLLQQAGAIHRAGNSGEIHLVAPRSTPTPSPLSSSAGDANLSLRGRKPSAHHAETARLQAMLSGGDDAEADNTIVTTAGEEVIYLPQYNSLGSEDARREVRPIKLLDTLVSRLTENIDGVVPHESDNEKQDARKKQIDDSIVAPGRMKFAERPQVWLVDHSKPVGELLTTTRDRLLGTPSGGNSSASNGTGSVSSTSEVRLPLPNKTAAPAKSILKVKDLDVTPASQIRWA